MALNWRRLLSNVRFAQNRTFRQSQRLTLRCSLPTTEANRPWDLAPRQADVGQHKFALRGRQNPSIGWALPGFAFVVYHLRPLMT
jgi:hypothetical protein